MEADMSSIETAKKDLERLERDLALWRSKNKGRTILPELWDEAVRLARILGVGRVARVTRLFYPSLKNRAVGTASNPAVMRTKRAPKMSFVEVPINPLPTSEASRGQESRLLFHMKSRFGILKFEWV
jgi:hypothetical protein